MAILRLNNKQVYELVQDLRDETLEPKNGDYVHIKEVTKSFTWIDGDSSVDDGLTIINQTSESANGRWLSEVSTGGISSVTGTIVDNTDPNNPIINAVLTPINEGNGIGYVIRGRNPANYGNVGLRAIDLSHSFIVSSTIGATGLDSFVANENNTASQQGATSFGINNIASNTYAFNGGGSNNTASGASSFTYGTSNFSRAGNEFSGGLFGTDYTPTSTPVDRLVNFGNGASVGARSDAFTIFKNGAVRIFRATLASILNPLSGMLIFDSGDSNRPTIHNGTAWKPLAYNNEVTFSTAPTSATDTGTTGEIRYTGTHIYVCIATNTWVRVAITTW